VNRGNQVYQIGKRQGNELRETTKNNLGNSTIFNTPSNLRVWGIDIVVNRGSFSDITFRRSRGIDQTKADNGVGENSVGERLGEDITGCKVHFFTLPLTNNLSKKCTLHPVYPLGFPL